MKNKNLSINISENYMAKILGIPSEVVKELVNKKILEPDAQGNYEPSNCIELYAEYKQGLAISQ